MRNIEVKILNPEVIPESEKMMVCAARMTQRGHQIKDMDSFMELYNKSYTEKTVSNMTGMPHPTIQKFGVINVVIVGASRRFLAQITRHQNEVKFMSASLQYSDYSGNATFAIPYGILKAGNDKVLNYLQSCRNSMKDYADFVNGGVDNDSAGFLAPQGLRNVLIISATPYQWKHMIAQRICRRNTDETRIVMLKIWNELYKINPVFFAEKTTGGPCQQHGCTEAANFACHYPMIGLNPEGILKLDYPLLFEEDKNEDKIN